MNRLHIRLGTWTITFCMFFVLSGISAMAHPQATTTDDQATTTTKKKKKKKAATDATASGDKTAASDTSAAPAKKSKKSKKTPRLMPTSHLRYFGPPCRQHRHHGQEIHQEEQESCRS